MFVRLFLVFRSQNWWRRMIHHKSFKFMLGFQQKCTVEENSCAKIRQEIILQQQKRMAPFQDVNFKWSDYKRHGTRNGDFYLFHFSRLRVFHLWFHHHFIWVALRKRAPLLCYCNTLIWWSYWPYRAEVQYCPGIWNVDMLECGSRHRLTCLSSNKSSHQWCHSAG